MAKFYVQARTRKGAVLGYSVCDEIGGIVSEHSYYEVGKPYSWEQALYLANMDRDDRNKDIK